jgi:putative transport protein
VIEWFSDALRQNPELSLLLALGLGFLLGRVRIGSFQLGPMLGCLIAGVAIGQLGIDTPKPMQSVFFLMFLFGLGFRTGPEFFQSLRADAWPQIALGVFLIACTVAVTWAAVRRPVSCRERSRARLRSALRPRRWHRSGSTLTTRARWFATSPRPMR